MLQCLTAWCWARRCPLLVYWLRLAILCRSISKVHQCLKAGASRTSTGTAVHFYPLVCYKLARFSSFPVPLFKQSLHRTSVTEHIRNRDTCLGFEPKTLRCSGWLFSSAVFTKRLTRSFSLDGAWSGHDDQLWNVWTDTVQLLAYLI